MIQTMLGINIVYNKIRTFFLMIYFGCFLTYFQKFPLISDKKELRFRQSFNKLYSPKIELDLNMSFLIACTVLMFAPESIHQMARFPFKKQNKTKQTNKQKVRLFKGGGTSPQTPPVRASKSFLNVKARSTPLYANKEAYIRT